MDYGMLLTGLAIVAAAVLLGSLGVDRKISRVERRLARIEGKLDAIAAGLDISLPEPGIDRVRALLAEGKKVEAVKAYRDSTGADLREAVEAVDRLAG